MRYSIELRDRIYVTGYGLLSFAKNMVKRLSNKYGQKLLDSARKSTADATKTASKRAIQKTTEATGDLIDNKIASKKVFRKNLVIIIIIIIINPRGFEIPGGNWNGIFKPSAVRLKCTQK